MHIAALHFYPVKSIRGLSPKSLFITEEGPEHDRRYMVVREDTGLFLTARNDPALLSVTARLDEDNVITLSAPGKDELRLPWANNLSRQKMATVWGDQVEALDTGDRAALWFSSLLGKAVRLVAMPPRGRVRLNKPGGDMAVSFADGYPLLGTSTASLNDLNDRLDTPITMARFRPNIVIDGSEAFGEDKWVKLQAGEVTFLATSACARCVLTTRDPITGAKDDQMEPMRSLGKYRRGGDGQTYFGTNLRPLNTGEICLGDKVSILESGDSLLP